MSTQPVGCFFGRGYREMSNDTLICAQDDSSQMEAMDESDPDWDEEQDLVKHPPLPSSFRQSPYGRAARQSATLTHQSVPDNEQQIIVSSLELISVVVNSTDLSLG